MRRLRAQQKAQHSEGATSKAQQGATSDLTVAKLVTCAKLLDSLSSTPPDVVERLALTGTITYNDQGVPISWQGKNGHGRMITLNLGPYKSAGELSENEFNRVTVPGDSDYAGVCKATVNHPQTVCAGT